MKKKNQTSHGRWGKRILSTVVSMAMAATLVPAFPAAQVKAAEPELLKAGTIPASDSTVTYGQPTSSGTAGSTQFRIPAFISVDNGAYRGNLVAAADARWTVTVDGGGLDTIASVSEDMGATWNYSFPIYFPDSNGYDGSNATTAIDPALVEGADGTIYCLADMNPTGITTYFGQVNQGTGFVKIDGVDRLVLTSTYSNANTLPTESDTTTYEYYVGDFDENGYAPVLKRSDNTESGYGVDEWYNLYTLSNGEYTADLTQTQTNSTTTIQQNAFYRDSILHVYNTGYIWMVKSTDGGWSWEDPTILNPQIKRPTGEYALLVSPGKGTTLKNGTIIIPFYDHGDDQENVSFIYSKDNGQNWKRTNDVSGDWTSESELVELEDGTLRMFSRTGTGKIAYADATMDENGDYAMGSLVQTNVAVTSTCNVTASVYSKKIDGKEVILVACPTGGSRANGKIFTFLVDADNNNSMELYATYSMPDEGYGTGYGYSCMDEQTDGTIGLYYEPNQSGVQRCIYTSLDFNDITGGVVTVDVSDGEPYTVTYEQVAADGNITQQPDSKIATAEVTHNTINGTFLYPYENGVSSSISAFSAAPDTNLALSDCEFTITSTGTADIYTVQSTKTNQYLANESSVATFFQDASANMKLALTSGSNTFRICKEAGNRFLYFHTDNMTINTNTNATDDARYEFTLLEKLADTTETGDDVLLPGYKRVSSITSGKQYLIAYIWQNNIIVLYPQNGVTNQTKLAKTGTNTTTTLTIQKGTEKGITTAVVDGKTYKILAEAQEVRLGKGNSFTIEAESGEGYTAEEGLQVTSETITGSLLYDHDGSGDGFSSTENPALTLEKAEVVLEGSGSVFKVKSNVTNMYLVNTDSTAMWSTTAGNLSFNKVDGEDGAYNICSGDTYATSSRHLCFYFTENNFNANGSMVTTNFSGSYALLVLEKKNQAAADDIIPGYQKVNTLTSGKSYLIAYVGTDGTVYVMYPVTNTAVSAAKNPMTKKYVKPAGSRLTVTGTEIGKYNLTVDGTLYVVNVNCLHKNVTISGRQEATCENAGYTGTMTCTDCNEVLSESVAMSAKGHWYIDGVCLLENEPSVEPSEVEKAAEELQEAVENKEAVYENGGEEYTDATWQAFVTAYTAAKNPSAEATAEELAELKLNLETAYAELVKKTDSSLTDAQAKMQEALAAAKAIYEAGQGSYTADTWAKFKSAYEALAAAKDSTNAEELTRFAAALTDAQAKLAKAAVGGGDNKPVPDPGTPSPVQKIEEGKVYDSGDYYYKVTSTSAKTAEVTGLKNKAVTKIVIYTSVKLGGETYKITSVAANAFKGNKKATSITVKKGATKIGNNAFASCTKVKKVTLKGTTLKTIGAKAFSGCKNLKSITIKSKVLKKVGKNAFKGIHKKATIKVPKASLKKYKKLLKKGQAKTVKIK